MLHKHFLLGLFAALFLLSQPLQAQETYKHGLGLRAGSSSGISYKTFFRSDLAFEGILSTRYYGDNGWGRDYQGGMITGLIEYHIPISSIPELSVYLGGGAHLAFWRGYRNHPHYRDDRTYAVLGVDAIVGLEYVFKDFPIALALDYKPSFHFGWNHFWGDEGALSIRFLLDRL